MEKKGKSFHGEKKGGREKNDVYRASLIGAGAVRCLSLNEHMQGHTHSLLPLVAKCSAIGGGGAC